MNGTGPSNCADIKAIGNSLKGFYMVRFNNKRINTIYCDFDPTNENTNMEKTKMPPKNQSNSSVRPEFLEFCKGLQNQPCKVLFSDYPDIQLFDINRNKSSRNVSLKNNIREPTDCEDLYAIGYHLKGFYWVSLNVKKVKLIYCDFNEIDGKYKKSFSTKRLASPNNTSTTKNTSTMAILPYCDAVGSQPCSCFYSTFPNLLQFELSNDELTRQATSANGTGPGSCEELKNIGYTLDGFYMVRFKTNIIKSIYCIFNYAEKDENNPKTTNECDIISRIRDSEDSTKCLTGVPGSPPFCDFLNPLDFIDKDVFVGTCLYLDGCNNSTKTQQWVFWNNSYVCTLQGDACFATDSTEMMKGTLKVVKY